MNQPLPAGRRKRPLQPKGRVPEPAAVDEVAAAIGPAPLRRDLLIEYLHAVQDVHGCLRHRHLAALAELTRLPQTEVYEVASFYAHFEVVPDDAAMAPVTVRVCDGLSCCMNGAEALAAALQADPPDGARVVRGPCMGRCDMGPAALVGRIPVSHATPDSVRAAVAAGATAPALPAYPNLVTYSIKGGYQLLRACMDGRRGPDQVIQQLDRAELRGLGGAGFPTARKWRIVRGQPGPRFLAVNADEGEPGTFKDRHILESDPHRFVEGMLIAAWAVDAAEIYVYLRDEYPHVEAILRKELAAVEASGLSGGRVVHLRRGAGAYICGEESAMLESIEGKRGYPRHRPPFVAEVGLFGRPTLVNNVETLYWVRDLLERRDEPGIRDRSGLRHYSVSGRVRLPGVKLAPSGITVRKLVDEHCGGMAEGHALAAYMPGGASGGVLPASLADLPLDFGSIEPHGGLIGSAAVIVLSDQDDIKAAALNMARFFAHESCGQCTPCRLGTAKAAEIMARPDWNSGRLEELSRVMRDASICGLGQAAPNVWDTVLRHFAEKP